MAIKILYHPLVVKKDIPSLDKEIGKRIHSAIEKKLGTNPVLYGVPLRAILKQYWKLRVGDWRIVYKIEKEEVKILIIGHRREIYSLAEKRK
jgi:mRNA interferase RelE/StbE